MHTNNFELNYLVGPVFKPRPIPVTSLSPARTVLCNRGRPTTVEY